MDHNSQTSEKTFSLTDGSAKLALGWRTAAELPDCREVGMAAARKGDGGYEFASAHATCPSCWSRVEAKPKGTGEGRSPMRKMLRVDLKGAAVVEADCADIADALLDREALGILELTGNVSIDEGAGLYMACPSCGRAFPVAMDGFGDGSVTIRNKGDEVEVEDSFGRMVSFSRNGGLGIWLDIDKDDPCTQLRVMGALKGAMLGVSAEARHYLDVSLGLAPGRPAVPDGVDLLDVAVRSRFRRGYDSRFHRDVKDVVMMIDPRRGDNLRPGSEIFKLPRDFQDDAVLGILAENRWPDTPDVRKAVKDRLALAVLMRHNGAGRVCGGDAEVVKTLLGSFAAGVGFACALHDDERVFSHGICDLFAMAARDEEPGRLVESLLKMGPDAIRGCAGEFRALGLGRVEAYAAYREARRERSLEEVLSAPGLLASYEVRRKGFRIAYTAQELSLASEVGGYRFSLLRTVAAVDAVGHELGDELLGHCRARAAFGENVFVLVATRSERKAMIRLDWNARVIERVAARGGRRVRRDGKLGRAIGAWAEANGVERRVDLFDDGKW